MADVLLLAGGFGLGLLLGMAAGYYLRPDTNFERWWRDIAEYRRHAGRHD